MSEAVGTFGVHQAPWPGGGVELRVVVAKLSSPTINDGLLTPGCVSEGEWRGQIKLLIEDLQSLEKRGLQKLRAAEAAGPKPIIED